MNPWTRFVRFNTVGAVGMGVQLGSLWFLSEVAHWHYLVATVAALALSVVHNFAWHWHWTTPASYKTLNAAPPRNKRSVM